MEGLNPAVSIVIVNYNARAYINACLDSVLKTRYDNFEIVVVDNGSQDESVKYLNEAVNINPRIKCVFNNSNLGPSVARNIGAEKTRGKYIAFLDNDTLVDSGWLNEPVRLFETSPDIGACQCKLILSDTDNIIDCVGEYLGQNGFLVQAAIPGEERDNGQYDNLGSIFAAKSAGMLIRKELFERIGGFDEDYFIYLEESDLCWRVWLHGFRVVLSPRSVVYHKFGTSSVVLSDKINYLVKFHGTKNYIATLFKNLGSVNLLIILPQHMIIWFCVMIVFLLKGQADSAKWILAGITWDFVHFRKLFRKRKIVQGQRGIQDNELFPKIMRRKSLSYFIAKIRRKKKIGQAVGWDKGS
ncbi:MAG: glycosyltransferase family 2 protein [Candidatus Omnitrophica bacterium]|nr:glycosyltransferase family 2 protein [Candidatus Omnitrophota bacterium]